MTEYCVEIFTNGKHPKCVFEFYSYEGVITYIAQNPLSSADEEYRIGVSCYDNGKLVNEAYLDPPEFAEDVEKIRKGEK